MSRLEWEEAITLLEEYVKEYDKLPKTGEMYRGVGLGTWFTNQRRIFCSGKYNPQRAERFRSIAGEKRYFDDKWEKNYELLQMFLLEYGRFPKYVEVYNDVKIGRWCSNQKMAAKNAEYPKERLEKLKQIGLLDTSRTAIWERHYQDLEDFIEEYNRFPKSSEIYRDFALGAWCSEQKLKAASGSYPLYRVRKLGEIGLLDNTAKPFSWEEKYQLLEEYTAEHQKLPAMRELYKGYALGRWYIMQKFSSKNPDYPAERLQKLEEISIFSTTQEAKWEWHYQLVLEFIAEYGRLPKQKESYRGERIGLWCTTQKQRHKKPSYPEEHRQKLRDIGLI